MLPSLVPPPGKAGEFSWPYMVMQGPQIIMLYVFKQKACPRNH